MNLQIGTRGDEVRSLQSDLNSILQYERPQLVLDGSFGMKTKDRVCKFQSLNGLKVDGIVGPKTAASVKMKRPHGIPGAPMPVPLPYPNVGSNAQKYETEMRQVFEQQGQTGEWMRFWNSFEQNTIPGMKTFLGVIGRAEDARALARFFIQLRKWGMTPQEIQLIFGKLASLKTEQALKLFETASKPAGSFGKMINFASDVAGKAGLVVLAIECAMHASRGDYSVILAEAYKYFMGKAVPWAAMVEGLGSLLDGVVPEQSRKNSLIFKILRACDPVGLGGSAVDSVSSLAIGLFEMVVSGKLRSEVMIPRLERLVGRLKQGPTAIFAEIGEDCGNALYEISEMEDIDFQAMMRYTWMEMKEFFTD